MNKNVHRLPQHRSVMREGEAGAKYGMGRWRKRRILLEKEGERERDWMPHSVPLFIFLRQGVSLNLELISSTRLAT